MVGQEAAVQRDLPQRICYISETQQRLAPFHRPELLLACLQILCDSLLVPQVGIDSG